jgi:hypothetical protein
MFNKKEPPKYQRMLEEELERAINYLPTIAGDPEEFAKKLAIVERLHAMMPREEPAQGVSKDTMATIGANLLGIFMIIKHENVNVISSKALQFVTRTRN